MEWPHNCTHTVSAFVCWSRALMAEFDAVGKEDELMVMVKHIARSHGSV